MQRYIHSAVSGQLPSFGDISLNINGIVEEPSRDEFYTNYPFFKYWNRDANQELGRQSPINIYIHIPFCIQICDFCFYMKELIKSKDQVDQYVEVLCREIEIVSQRLNLSQRPVNAIYIGGGTPSVLSEKQFRRIIETLHKYHSINTPEFSFEAEPGTFSRSKLQWYKDCGVNRISMGVQSFNDEIIEMSSRKHTAQQAINSIETVKDVGGFIVNIDLLSGLAGETMKTWESSLEIATQQQIDMLTVYKMKTYSNTIFFQKAVKDRELVLPDGDDELAFMDRAMTLIPQAGFGMWSTFALNRNGSDIKYIESSYRGDDMIGYGASSFGKIGHINYQNLNTTQLYFDKVKAGEIPVYRTYSMSSKDLIVRELLLCGVRLLSYKKWEFVSKFGFDYFDIIPDTIHELRRKGYILDQNDELVLTRQGVIYGDFVAKVISSSVKNALSPDKIRFVY
jgi:oxygen-independent coproporphyrinogen III oxidase